MWFKMSEEEIYTKEEHYQDWFLDNVHWLKLEFIDEKWDEFEAYCRQQFKDRG